MPFQSTLPRRERQAPPAAFTLDSMPFQSTLPRRERPTVTVPGPSCSGFQSTLPRRERPHFFFLLKIHCLISIHAPAKGATKQFPDPDQCYTISIHAPAKGATKEFRSTPDNVVISIHAPAKGATLASSSKSAIRWFDFNPRSREGSDLRRQSIVQEE